MPRADARFLRGQAIRAHRRPLPATKDVSGTNYCDITVRLIRGRLIVLSLHRQFDQGCRGVAVQNFNLMYGFDETTAL